MFYVVRSILRNTHFPLPKMYEIILSHVAIIQKLLSHVTKRVYLKNTHACRPIPLKGILCHINYVKDRILFYEQVYNLRIPCSPNNAVLSLWSAFDLHRSSAWAATRCISTMAAT